ncbi:hypothetical protein D3C72_278950 [compost metagenome]
MKYVEITQDGAGLVLAKDAETMGLYTKDVESCAVYAMWGSEGILMIHDTAQIKIEDISALVRKIGKVKRILFAVNKRLENHSRKTHNEKRQKLSNITKVKKMEIVDLPSGMLSIDHLGFEITKPNYEIYSFPNKEKRLKIMFYNNLFSPTNSQLVNVDFQFDGTSFTDLPKLQKNIEEMRKIAMQKAREGDSDFINWLEKDLNHLT